MSKTIKPFTIDQLSDCTGSKPAEFVSAFTKSDKRTRPAEPVTAEDKGRKIFEDAFAQGEKAGHEMGMKKVDQIAKRLNSSLGELAAFRDQLKRKAEALSVELALVFAEALVLRECSERREVVLDMARRAFEICEDKCDILVRVRREDAVYLRDDTLTDLKIVPDDSLKEPGFIIETGFGDIDGRISTQLDELRKEFLNERSG